MRKNLWVSKGWWGRRDLVMWCAQVDLKTLYITKKKSQNILRGILNIVGENTPKSCPSDKSE